MKINGIEYSRTFNLGNYESETVKISLAIEETEQVTAQEAVKFARREAGLGSLAYERQQAKKAAQNGQSEALKG